MKKKVIISSFIILLGICCATIFWFYGRPLLAKQSQLQTVTMDTLVPTSGISSPTPMPFAEMTIPYLRNRTFASTLGERTVYANNGTYTSYLTSYTSDGLKINGLLTVPTGEMPAGGWPAVVFVHGYIPPTQYTSTNKYVDYVDYLARNGFVVFKIDLRGHGTSEGEPGGAYYSSDYVIDTLNAYAALESDPEVNKAKIGLWGHSMAGNIVMRSLAAKPSIPAVVIWGGAVYTYFDLQDYRITDNSYVPPASGSAQVSKRQRLMDTVGPVSTDSAFWQQTIPTNYLTDVTGAIAVHHAVDDNVVSVEYARNLKSILDSTSINHEIYEYSSGGHNIIGPSFVTAMQRTVDFYKKYLKVDPSVE